MQACYVPRKMSKDGMKLIDWRTTPFVNKDGLLSRPGRSHFECLDPACHPGSPGAQEMLQCSQRRTPTAGRAFEHCFGMMTGQRPAAPASLWWQDCDMPAFVMQSARGMQQGDGRCQVAGLAQLHARLHIRCLVFAHFFSGYRRTGDLHEILGEVSLGGSTMLYVLSVDLCMQRQSGDLARPEALSWWQQRAASGQLAGCGGGPPCETHSAACCSDDGGPRQLRDQAHPAGRPGLRKREWAQLDAPFHGDDGPGHGQVRRMCLPRTPTMANLVARG